MDSSTPLDISGQQLPGGGFAPKPFRTGSGTANWIQRAAGLPLLPVKDGSILKMVLRIALIMATVILTSLAGQKIATFATLPLLALTVIGLALTDTWTGLMFFLCYNSLEGLYKYTSEFSTLVYCIGPFIAAAIYIGWTLSPQRQASKERGEEASQPPMAILLYSLALLVAIQLFNPNASTITNSIAGAFVWYLCPLSSLFVSYYTVRNSRNVLSFLYVIVGIATVMCAYALVQYKLGGAWCNSHLPGYRSITTGDWFVVHDNGTIENGVFRPASTSPMASGYAPTAVYGIIAAVALLLMPEIKLRSRILISLCLPIIGGALILAAVRSTVLIAVITVPLLVILNARSFSDLVRTYCAVLLTVSLGVGVFLGINSITGNKIGARYEKTFQKPVETFVKERGINFVALVNMIQSQPLGVGIQRNSTTANVNVALSPMDRQLFANRETLWSALQGDTGIVGIFLVASFLIGTLAFVMRMRNRIPDARLRTALLGLGAIVFSLLLGTLAGPLILSNYVFWITVGTLLAIPRIVQNEMPARRKLLEVMNGTGEDPSETNRERRRLLRTAEEGMGAGLVQRMARDAQQAPTPEREDRQEPGNPSTP